MNKEKLKEFYFKYQIIVLPVLSGLASLIIISLVIVPHFLTYLSVQKQISGTKNSTTALEAKAQELENLDETKLKQNLQTVFTVLPADQEVPQAMVILQNLIQRSGLSLVSTVYVAGGREAKGGGGSFVLNITVDGPLYAVKNFFTLLQTAPRVIQIQSAGVRFLPSSNITEVEIPIMVYFSLPASPLGKPDQVVPHLSAAEEDLLARLSLVVGQGGESFDATSSAVPLGKGDPFQ